MTTIQAVRSIKFFGPVIHKQTDRPDQWSGAAEQDRVRNRPMGDSVRSVLSRASSRAKNRGFQPPPKNTPSRWARIGNQLLCRPAKKGAAKVCIDKGV